MKEVSIDKGYGIWHDTIFIPLKKEDGSVYYWKKEIPFEEAKNYWEYIQEDDVWNLYYVKRGVSRRLAQYNIGKFHPNSIIVRLADKDITINDCRRIEEEGSRPVERIPVAGVFWSIDYDGKSVFELMEDKEKMPYSHIKMVIINEGGFIDDKGIIHRGTCKG